MFLICCDIIGHHFFYVGVGQCIRLCLVIVMMLLIRINCRVALEHQQNNLKCLLLSHDSAAVGASHQCYVGLTLSKCLKS